MNLPNEKFPLKTLMYKHTVGGQRGEGIVESAGAQSAQTLLASSPGKIF